MKLIGWRWLYLDRDGKRVQMDGREIHDGDGPDADVAKRSAAREFPVVPQRLYVEDEPGAAHLPCGSCSNRGRTVPGDQESFCSRCVWGEPWKRNHYQPKGD